MDFSKNEEKNICLRARGYSVVHPLPLVAHLQVRFKCGNMHTLVQCTFDGLNEIVRIFPSFILPLCKVCFPVGLYSY